MDIADLEERALDGDKEAIQKLIEIYETGDGAEKSEELAEHWRNELAQIEEENENDDSPVMAEAEHVTTGSVNSASSADKKQILSWHSEWVSGNYSKKMIAALQGQIDNPYAQWSCGRQLSNISPNSALPFYERAQQLFLPYIDQADINKDFYSLLVEIGDLYTSLDKEEDAFRSYMQAHELSTAKSDLTSSLKLLGTF